MEKLIYKQAFDKITEAYIKGEIEPYDTHFCFCGTLAPNENWMSRRTRAHPYKFLEYAKMEAALLNGLGATVLEVGCDCDGGLTEWDEGYEDALFSGMCAALEVLKEIHRERGEDVDAHSLVFEKRGVVL